MLFLLLCAQAALHVSVVSETPPLPPQNVKVDKWLLTWTAAPGDQEVTYTVQFRSFDNGFWEDVPSCIQTSSHSCNIVHTKEKSEHGCAMLRVMAQRGGLTSAPVKACSRHGDSCSPGFRLSARPGSLTVLLSGNHNLTQEYGDHVQHRVYYGKEGESLQESEESKSSVTFSNLEEGQRYCAKVQYIYFGKAVGPASCIQCEVIPESRPEPNPTKVIVVVIVALFLAAAAMAGIAYTIFYKLQRIKQWLRPPCHIPEHYHLKPFPEPHRHLSARCISEEDFDTITSIE